METKTFFYYNGVKYYFYEIGIIARYGNLEMRAVFHRHSPFDTVGSSYIFQLHKN